MNKIEIPLSKTKITLMILGSAFFIVAGVLIFFLGPEKQTYFKAFWMKITGVASVLFFGTTGIVGLRKLFDKKAGLILDEEGIIDNSSGVSIGLIHWNDVTDIKVEQVMSNKFLLIFLADPEKYFESANVFKRKMMKANIKMYGTPISISSSALEYNFDALQETITKQFKKYKRP